VLPIWKAEPFGVALDIRDMKEAAQTRIKLSPRRAGETTIPARAVISPEVEGVSCVLGDAQESWMLSVRVDPGRVATSTATHVEVLDERGAVQIRLPIALFRPK
jgi:hypothetical protein